MGNISRCDCHLYRVDIYSIDNISLHVIDLIYVYYQFGLRRAFSMNFITQALHQSGTVSERLIWKWGSPRLDTA